MNGSYDVVYSAALERAWVLSQQRPPMPVPHNTPRAPARAQLWEIVNRSPRAWWTIHELGEAMRGETCRTRLGDILAEWYAEGRVERRKVKPPSGWGTAWAYRVKP